ncbi:MAG: cardiolipin synthase [Brachybacterium sp.]|nr:cardiolipin synthase [Brachybacterium sp.]
MLTTAFLVLEYAVKIVALGTIPENRKPSSSSAWLLLILFLPVVGIFLYLLIGSPYVTGRRHRIQDEINAILTEYAEQFPLLPPGSTSDPHLRSVLRMNREQTGMAAVSGCCEELYEDTEEFFAALAASIDAARTRVDVLIYITDWDETTDVFYRALERAVARGVRVCFLMDHWGSRTKAKRWRELQRSLTAIGVDWHLAMPLNPLRGRWRRPDLRNHRKLVIIDSEVAFLGSHNIIDPAYGSAANRRVGRLWNDLSVRMTGNAVVEIEAVFASDWYIETGEILPERYLDAEVVPLGEGSHPFQIVPSGPGFPSEPNMRMFVALVHGATRNVRITSPYFVPNDALLNAITSAALRGVQVDLFVSEKADQFIVGHAQRSYYNQLLRVGVRIHLYAAPKVLHSKYLTVDDRIGAIGTSNMDYRSFALSYEVMMLSFDGDLVGRLRGIDDLYEENSRVLTAEEWEQEPWYRRYVDNVCRLAAALM